MDNRHFLCFDFETGGKSTETAEVLQIGACIVHRNSLTIVDSFESLMKPEDFDALEDEALAINGLTREKLREAPEPALVWATWAKWIQRHNVNKAKNSFGAPIAMYYNGDNFDMAFMQRYCKKYGYWDNKWGNQTLVNPIYTLDVMKHLWFWFRSVSDGPKNLKLTTVLEYMGVPKEEIDKGAHNALWDVTWTAKIGVRLLNVGSYLTTANDEGKRRLEMKDCFQQKDGLKN